MTDKTFIAELTKALVDNGQLIEAGWIGLRYVSLPQHAPQVQIDCMREAFFAGAQHLFSSIMNILEPGTEATDKDYNRLTIIASELETFATQYKKKHNII